jgi:hypothetical protein
LPFVPVGQHHKLHTGRLVVPKEARLLGIAQVPQIDIDRPEFVMPALAISLQAGEGRADGVARCD